MKRNYTIFAAVILIFSSCVSKKQMDEAIRTERNNQELKWAKMEEKVQQQQREIGILKDSLREKSRWKSQYISHLMDGYEKAILLREMKTATNCLQLLITEEPTAYPWAYDSLAFYHYFYGNPVDLARSTSLVNYMIDKGLSLDKSNLYLREMRARVLLIEQDDTGAVDAFRQLFKETGDYTYRWYELYIEIARGNVKTAETAVQQVLKADVPITKKVRLHHLQEQIQENLGVKPSFLYLKALVQQVKQQYQPMANTLKDALKADPGFYLAAKTLQELRQASQGAIR
jgi:tetratricopeptide (TPR) repeat protein